VLAEKAERFEVDFSQGTFINHAVTPTSAVLDLVAEEVLGAGGDVLALDAIDILCREEARQMGIFTVRLEVSAIWQEVRY
jgi:hypothetical protein